jgi:hypothetical protein
MAPKVSFEMSAVQLHQVVPVVLAFPFCVGSLATHHQRAQHPPVRHAYRLSQVITYGYAAPQTFVH